MVRVKTIVLSGLGICLCWSSANAAPPLGKAAPDFRLRDCKGAMFRLSDLAYPRPLRARRPRSVVLLDFFRTDCAPCRKALPKLVALHKKHHDKGLKLLLVALLEEEEGEQKLQAFLATQHLPFPVLVDRYGMAAKKYVRKGTGFAIPALFLIARNGILRARSPQCDEKFHKLLEQLLGANFPKFSPKK